jgi:hypothetical protein
MPGVESKHVINTVPSKRLAPDQNMGAFVASDHETSSMSQNEVAWKDATQS